MKKLIAIGVGLVVGLSAHAASTHSNEKNAFRRNQFVLQSDTISIAGVTSVGGALKLYDLPEGNIIVHGVVADVVATAGTNVLVTGETLNVGVGTAANANGAWAASETNLGSSAIAFTSGVTRARSILASPVRIDGTAAAADIYLNVFSTNALITNGSVSVQGQVQVLWSQVGDY